MIGLSISFIYLPTVNTVPMSPFQTIVTIPQGAQFQNSTNGFFVPSNVTVVLGVNNTVGWRNFDANLNATYPGVHSAHSDQGLWFSGNIPAAVGSIVYTNYYTFTQAGTYPYHCNQHSYMYGVIIVKSK